MDFDARGRLVKTDYWVSEGAVPGRMVRRPAWLAECGGNWHLMVSTPFCSGHMGQVVAMPRKRSEDPDTEWRWLFCDAATGRWQVRVDQAHVMRPRPGLPERGAFYKRCIHIYDSLDCLIKAQEVWEPTVSADLLVMRPKIRSDGTVELGDYHIPAGLAAPRLKFYRGRGTRRGA